MHSTSFRLVPFFLVLLAAACASSSPASPALSSVSDSGSQAPNGEPSDARARSEASTLSCGSISAYCATSWCLKDWSAVKSASSRDLCNAGYDRRIGRTPLACGPYKELTFAGVDTSTTFYYDANSAALVGIARDVNGSVSCLAGAVPVKDICELATGPNADVFDDAGAAAYEPSGFLDCDRLSSPIVDAAAD